ncbi:hypothetical protein KQX54_004046 [Cotesia glomerata]|uniref:Uncharacterized protein n=1 Tax=Cotesia glomerata TaxID=32391 RepID=A0AAV7IBJ8_COTGL|nr:hypothetical protein KQX54_004046 [Cotesia glomerata]
MVIGSGDRQIDDLTNDPDVKRRLSEPTHQWAVIAGDTTDLKATINHPKFIHSRDIPGVWNLLSIFSASESSCGDLRKIESRLDPQAEQEWTNLGSSHPLELDVVAGGVFI